MNKGKLKKFAVNARRELLEKVELQARLIGITEENIKEANVESSDAIFIDGKRLSNVERRQRNKLIHRIAELGFNQVMEEAAYTWFNRIIALRFMEVNDYLPTRVRVLSSIDGGTEPDMIKEALNLSLDLDKEYIRKKKLNSETDELFKYLIIAHCNDLNDYLPFMFGTIEDYTEILFPEGLLNTDSFVRGMVDTEAFPEGNWHEVEIIGWLYQYYISEENDRLIRAKKQYKPEEIPAVTQLFTPEWIVRYMVQNTLGKKWIEAHPEDRDLIDNWEYYLENTNPNNEEQKEIGALVNPNLKVEELTLIDPAMGSGHILVYMFEVLREIYLKQGYTEREISRQIIENNLHGLDIDERAYQLTAFSVIMKGLEYNGRFLRDIKRNGIKLNLGAIEDTNSFTEEDIQFLANQNIGLDFDKMKKFINQFDHAKEIGSLIIIDDIDTEFLTRKLSNIETIQLNLIEIGIYDKVYTKFKKLMLQAKLLSNTYDVYVTNPPYLARKYQTPAVKLYLDDNYDDVNGDLYSSFIVSSQRITKKYGHIGLMTPYVWMFISSHEKLREKIINNSTINSLIQLEYSGFDGATVPICTFTLKNNKVNLQGEYIRLSDFIGSKNQPIKTREAIKNSNVSYRYTTNQNKFKKIPRTPIAYWASDQLVDAFKNGVSLDQISDSTGAPIKTANNNKYLRLWWEINRKNMDNNGKWLRYAKGGSYRKYYGNLEYVIDWSIDARNYYNENKTSNLYNEKYWYKEGINYNKITTKGSSFRYLPEGFVFDTGGPTITFVENIYYLIGFLNSKVTKIFLDMINPTINIQIKDIQNLPIIIEDNYIEQVEEIVRENIKIYKDDWNIYETSWDFKKHPIIKYSDNKLSIEKGLCEYNVYLNNQINILKENEKTLNETFLDIYKLDAEYSPEVKNNEITVSRMDNSRDIISFISYAVGCMFGRYSLDQEGLVYAGGQFDSSKYEKYEVVEDNIIPIASNVYIENDIVNRFVEFVKTVYGKETLEENLVFISDAIGQKRNETSRETLHRYFLNDFYSNHAKMYSVTGSGRRPIYWQFTSGKEKAFNAFIYIHRYDKTTLSRIRTDYVHEVQQRLEIKQSDLDNIINSDASASEINKARKDLKSVEKQIAELIVYDEKLHHMADQQIEIDLDDGFKVNYPKFGDLVAKV